MSVLIKEGTIAGSLLEQRRASGRDRYDEVWDGVCVISPMADNEHQDLATELAAILRTIIDWQGLGRTLAGADKMLPVAVISPRQPATIVSDVLPLRIACDAEASCIRVSNPSGQRIRDIPLRLDA